MTISASLPWRTCLNRRHLPVWMLCVALAYFGPAMATLQSHHGAASQTLEAQALTSLQGAGFSFEVFHPVIGVVVVAIGMGLVGVGLGTFGTAPNFLFASIGLGLMILGTSQMILSAFFGSRVVQSGNK